MSHKKPGGAGQCLSKINVTPLDDISFKVADVLCNVCHVRGKVASFSRSLYELSKFRVHGVNVCHSQYHSGAVTL
jgi:hypothetical protein